MADTKISDLTALTGANVADDDEFVIVDTSALVILLLCAADVSTITNSSSAATLAPVRAVRSEIFVSAIF